MKTFNPIPRETINDVEFLEDLLNNTEVTTDGNTIQLGVFDDRDFTLIEEFVLNFGYYTIEKYVHADVTTITIRKLEL